LCGQRRNFSLGVRLPLSLASEPGFLEISGGILSLVWNLGLGVASFQPLASQRLLSLKLSPVLMRNGEITVPCAVRLLDLASWCLSPGINHRSVLVAF
jgi:hypothetical protein